MADNIKCTFHCCQLRNKERGAYDLVPATDATNFVFSHLINNGYKLLRANQYQYYINIINYIDPSLKETKIC